MRTLLPLLFAVAIVCSLSVSAASAQTNEGVGGSTSAAAPRPAPELDQLKSWTGAWKCKGQTYASSFGPAHPTRSSFTTKHELDGFWYVTRFGEKKTAENPNPLKMVAATGYDPSSKKLVQIGFDNFGGRWTETADSATPDKPVFSGKYTLNGNEVGVRDTYSYEGRKSSHLGEIQVGGDWKKLDEETCKK